MVHPPVCSLVFFTRPGTKYGPRVPTDLRYLVKILKFGGGKDEPSLIVASAMIQEMDRSVSNQNGTEQELRKQILKATHRLCAPISISIPNVPLRTVSVAPRTCSFY